MLKREMNIADYDAELWQAMEQEKVRQEEHIELIASENYTSPRVMQAQGSQLTNKYDPSAYVVLHGRWNCL